MGFGERRHEHAVPLREPELLQLPHRVLEQRDRRLGFTALDVRVAEKAGGVDAAYAVRGQLSAALGVVDGDGSLSAHRRYPARREGRVALQARVADRLAYRGRAAGGLLHLGAFPEKD